MDVQAQDHEAVVVVASSLAGAHPGPRHPQPGLLLNQINLLLSKAVEWASVVAV